MKKHLNFRGKLTGFTLIELLVVIVIIGVLATISVSTFSGYFERARLAKAQASYSQIKTLFLAQNASTENEFFTGWYAFDGDNDVKTNSPYLLDKTEQKNHLNEANLNNASFRQSSDTPLKTGKSLKTNRAQIYKIGLFSGRPVNKITFAFWFKKSDEITTCPIYSGTSAIWLLENGKIKFLLDNNNSLTTRINTYKNNKWHYLIASYGDKIMRIWLDGKLVDSKNEVILEEDLLSGWKGVSIGYNSIGRSFNGWLDEIMFFPYSFDGKKLK